MKSIIIQFIISLSLITEFINNQAPDPSSSEVEAGAEIPDAPRCTSGSCGECLTALNGEAYCNLCLNGHTLKFNLEYVQPIDLSTFDPFTATCSDAPQIPNCKRLSTNNTLASA